jgi:type IV pilus assembly protein PilA
MRATAGRRRKAAAQACKLLFFEGLYRLRLDCIGWRHGPQSASINHLEEFASQAICRKGGQEVHMRQQQGFSVIELLIVVAIILIIAAIAIPNLLQAKIAANEASAAGSIRAIKSAEFAYSSAYPTVGYAAAISDLGGASPCTPSVVTGCLLDNALALAIPGSPGKSGYVFLATGIAGGGGGPLNSAFVAAGGPIAPKSTGNRDFCSTDDGVLRVQPNATGVPVTTTAACLAYPIAQ